jgi:hypothetical protein
VWHDDHAGDPSLGVHPKIGALPFEITRAVRDEHVPSTLDGIVLDTAGGVDESWVVGIEQKHSDRLRVPRPEMPGRLVPDEAELGDRLLDRLPLGVADPLGMVQHVRHRALGHARPPGDVLCRRSSRLLTVHGRGPSS